MATCPNCTARIRQTAAECPSCGALFGAGSAWKPVADSTDTPGGARAHEARSTPAAARGDTQRILARIQQFLRDERIDPSTRDSLRELSDAVSNLDTPFHELISDSAARLVRLAESHRFSEALWEIDLVKGLPFDSLDVPRWDEDDFYARIYPGYIRRVNDAVRSRRLVQQVALAQSRVESLANDQGRVTGKNDLTGTDGRTSRRQPVTAQSSPGAHTQASVTSATPVKQGSVAFAVVTTLFYIFLYPVGLILNFIGLITGPRRGCFVSLLLLFVVLPVILIVAVLKTGAQFAIPYVTDIVRFVEGWLRHFDI